VGSSPPHPRSQLPPDQQQKRGTKINKKEAANKTILKVESNEKQTWVGKETIIGIQSVACGNGKRFF
jgi:hypothetical protein